MKAYQNTKTINDLGKPSIEFKVDSNVEAVIPETIIFQITALAYQDGYTKIFICDNTKGGCFVKLSGHSSLGERYITIRSNMSKEYRIP